MSEQTIPAEKVRELIDAYAGAKNDGDDVDADVVLRDLRALLPTQQPTTGLLGRWAKHPERGDVMCVWDKARDGWLNVHKREDNDVSGVELYQVHLADLTFPHQATKPADVPADQPWLVDVEAAHVTEKNVMGVRNEDGDWRLYCREKAGVDYCTDEGITLVCPLTPERPVSDLQVKSTERALDRVMAKYDELKWEYKQAQVEITWLKAGNTPRVVATPERPRKDDLQAKYDVLVQKYEEAQERIKALEQATPRIVRTPEEYDALPVGSVVKTTSGYKWKKYEDNRWRTLNSLNEAGALLHDHCTRTVLRYGWGDEQPKPAWRIEHDWQNLQVGEYIIDMDGDDGAVTYKWRGRWGTDGDAYGAPQFAPFIVFPNKDAATPEAILEAKKARDKETGE